MQYIKYLIISTSITILCAWWWSLYYFLIVLPEYNQKQIDIKIQEDKDKKAIEDAKINAEKQNTIAIQEIKESAEKTYQECKVNVWKEYNRMWNEACRSLKKTLDQQIQRLY